MQVFYSLFNSRISSLATISVVVLCGIAVWRIQSFVVASFEPSYVAAAITSQESVPAGADYEQEMLLLGLATTSNPSATSDTDPLEMIGPIVVAQLAGQYAGLLDSGGYSDERGTAAVEQVAKNVRAAISYKTYIIADFKTDSDTSFARMLVYRADMRDAIAPLLENTQSEFEIYGKYVETSDPSHLDTLREVAGRYKKAAANASAVVVPRDAVNYHKDILNAMEQFAATLEAMASHPDDAFASIALLRSYNDAEQKMFYSFDALGSYYGQKTP